MVAALVTVSVGGAHLGAAVIARHRAQSAADLAALAGAAQLSAGPARACARADRIARSMDTHAECLVEGLDVVVTVTARAGGLRWSAPATAVARAGPQERPR